MKYDVIVLGAGMVGVSCALHLQRKNLSVALLDRRAPGLETSFGNAGLIQRETIAPYQLPRSLAFLLSGLTNRRIDVQYHVSAALRMAGPLWSYFRYSGAARYREVSRDYETLIALSLETHAELMAEAHAEALVGGTDGQMISNIIAFHMQRSNNWELAAALGSLLLALILILYWLYDRLVGASNIKLG